LKRVSCRMGLAKEIHLNHEHKLKRGRIKRLAIADIQKKRYSARPLNKALCGMIFYA